MTLNSTADRGRDLMSAVADPRAADPAEQQEAAEVLVPACNLGADVAWVRDARTGERHRLERPPLALVGGAVCVRAVGCEDADGLYVVALPGGALVRVPAVPVG